MNISREGQEIGFLVHNMTLEPSLEQMSMTAVPAIEINRIGGQKATHEFRETRPVGAFQKEMEMGVHQAPRMNTHGQWPGISGYIVEKFPPVPLITEYYVAGIASGDHMIQTIREIYSFRSRHNFR